MDGPIKPPNGIKKYKWLKRQPKIKGKPDFSQPQKKLKQASGEERWLDEGHRYMGRADRGSLGTWRKGEKTQVDREKPRGEGGKVKVIGIFCFFSVRLE